MAVKQAVSVIFDRKKECEKKGTGIVEIRIYFSGGVRKYISLGRSTAMEFAKIAKKPEVKNMVEKYEGILSAMKTLGEEISVANFEACLNHTTQPLKTEEAQDTTTETIYNGQDQNASFLEFIREIQTMEDIAWGTMKQKKVVLRSLEDFSKISTFADLTPANVMAYDRWLHNGSRRDVTIACYHKVVHYYINILMMEERIPRDPYKHVRIKKGTSEERDPLTEDELIKVRDVVLSSEKLDRVRDLFIFMAYTGLAYCDAQNFDYKKMTMHDPETGLMFIDGRRLKTKTKYFTPILPPAQKILEKRSYHLPKISNQKANDYLHLIEEKLEIVHPMTCHIARHSFATLCLAHGIPFDNVSKMLGHTNLKTTMRYAKTKQSTIRQNTGVMVGKLL